jgi:hypothetical protein
MVSIIKKGTSKQKIEALLSKKETESKSKKSIAEFAGKLKTKINPSDFQKELRNEWE